MPSSIRLRKHWISSRLRARFDRLKKHTIYHEREDGMFFLFYGGDRFCNVSIFFRMDPCKVLILSGQILVKYC